MTITGWAAWLIFGLVCYGVVSVLFDALAAVARLARSARRRS